MFQGETESDKGRPGSDRVLGELIGGFLCFLEVFFINYLDVFWDPRIARERWRWKFMERSQ